MYIKCLNIHQLNIIKIIKKDFNKEACERYQSLPKEQNEKKETIWTMQKSTRRLKAKACRVKAKACRV